MKLSLTFSKRLALLLLLLMLGLMLSGGMDLLLGRVSDNQVAVARISMVCQGFVGFILPAVVLAMLVTRLPADFLMIKRFPKAAPLGLAIVALIFSIWAIEWINSLCELIPWPQSVLELEAQAMAQIKLLLGPNNVPNLLVSILVLGVLTGLSEELFFRGALQRVFQTRPMSVHVAIWITAVIFSLMHGQMVGFIPRALLGALFGYAAVWTGSVWTAVILHALNNSVAVLAMWIGFELAPNNILGVISTVLTGGAFVLLWRRTHR